ncbi:MAG TPA: hypothetical protein VMJ10_34305, partial [Kofleriaceae bacterium]|nr:hypothetical protein [Kofleriaceae bacterium]
MRSLCASAVVCAAFTACAPATSSQQQAVILGPLADYTFPDTVIGSISPPYTYTLQDRSGLGVQMDTITAIHASCPGFMFTTLPPVGTVISITLGGSDGSNWTTMNAAITVAFAPTSQGTDTCTFYVVFNNGIDDDSLCNTDANHLCANLTGTGIEPPMVFGESPDPVDFGDVALGTSATPITYTMTNGGSGPNDPILESATFVPDVNNVLSWIPPPLPATISHGGGKLAFTLNCTHPVEGPNNGMMSFHFMPQTPDVTPKDYMVMVSCTGKDTTLQFEPAPVLITGPPEQTSGCMR